MAQRKYLLLTNKHGDEGEIFIPDAGLLSFDEVRSHVSNHILTRRAVGCEPDQLFLMQVAPGRVQISEDELDLLEAPNAEAVITKALAKVHANGGSPR